MSSEMPKKITKQYDVGELSVEDKLNLAIPIAKVDGQRFLSPDNGNENMNGSDWLKAVGELAKQEFQIDLGSRSGWEEDKAKELKLFMSHMDKKTYPWEGASNVNLPFITIACVQYQSRAVEAMLPKEICRAVDIGQANPARVERVTDYMNYQFRYKMPDFEDGMDKTLMQLGVAGSVFRKSYYDMPTKMVNSVYLPSVDFVVNYGAKTLDSAFRKSQIMSFQRNELRNRASTGIFTPAAWNLGPGSMLRPSADLKEASDTVMNMEEPTENRGTPRCIIEMHTMLDYDGDGLDEPCVIVFDYESGEVLRLYSRAYQRTIGEEVRDEVMNYFTDYHFLPNPEGFYGLGLGTLLRGLNESANTIVNEIIDAGHLANMQGGFVAKRSGIKRGALKFKMGEYKEVDAYLDDIRKAIYHFDFKGPNDTLYATLGLLYEYAKLVSSVSETTTGQLPASDTPASTVLALIEEGRKVYSAIHRRTHRSFKKELSKLFRLNSIFINEDEYYRVIGSSGYPEGDQQVTGSEDFQADLDVFPVSDPMITSKAEQIIKAKEFRDEVYNNPDTSQSPEARYRATLNYFKALDIDQPEAYIQPPPPPPDIPPFEENAMFLKEETAQVLPTQQHMHHIEVHQSMLEGAYANQLTATAKQIMEQHHLEHMAAMYLQEMQAAEQEQAAAAQAALQGGV